MPAEKYEDWKLGRTDLAEWLAQWPKAGWFVLTAQPEVVIGADGAAYHRYWMRKVA